MQRHFDEELAALKSKLLQMGSLVEEQIQEALRALVNRDETLARKVINNDLRVNTMDVEVDGERMFAGPASNTVLPEPGTRAFE